MDVLLWITVTIPSLRILILISNSVYTITFPSQTNSPFYCIFTDTVS
jgi:hypothetical protein